MDEHANAMIYLYLLIERKIFEPSHGDQTLDDSNQ